MNKKGALNRSQKLITFIVYLIQPLSFFIKKYHNTQNKDNAENIIQTLCESTAIAKNMLTNSIFLLL